MQTYIAAEFSDLLAYNQLSTFSELWAKKIDWLEEPNKRNEGWSGVGRLHIADKEGEAKIFFLKKQQNFCRRTWRHPIKGESTLKREFERLQFLALHDITVPTVVFYAEGMQDNMSCAILLTEELSEYVDLATIFENWSQDMNAKQKKRILQNVAFAIRKFHDLGLVHRAMYPKHIFIKKQEDKCDIAFIDLEKSRFVRFLKARATHDLATLYKRATKLTIKEKLFFVHAYLATKSLDRLQKKLVHEIIKRAKN